LHERVTVRYFQAIIDQAVTARRISRDAALDSDVKEDGQFLGQLLGTQTGEVGDDGSNQCDVPIDFGELFIKQERK
jgi:hypothetical protein